MSYSNPFGILMNPNTGSLMIFRSNTLLVIKGK